jgi:hypothetical protein
MHNSKTNIYPTPLGEVFKFPSFSPENQIVRGEEGVPWIDFF